ncbi:MAG: hypothetical protein KF823_08025 [Xanthomonadales bacterium]|nr:hypothetical protein [Xanthomonadales bacterium]
MSTTSNEPRDPLLQRALESLPRRREPGRDLWPDIAGRLPPRDLPASPAATRRRGVWKLALAAGLAAALLVRVLLQTHPFTPTPDPQAFLANDPAQALIEAYADVLAAETEAGSVGVALWEGGDATRRAAVRELDTVTAALAAALRSEPDSQLLRRLLHQTLQQRAALARQFHHV